MSISEAFVGSHAVDTTEWSCTADSAGAAAQTGDGVYQVFLDLQDMVEGDVLQVRIYEKVGPSSAQQIVAEWVLRGVQSTPIWVSPTLILIHGWDATLDALAGTITVDWSIRRVA